MTKDYVLYNLREAAEELGRYHHLNTAWNARHASADDVTACTAADFKRWRQFPTDINMSLGS